MALHRKSLSITYWNARGSKSKILELTAFLRSSGCEIMLLGETFLKPRDKFSMLGYSIYHTDRPDNQGGGTAILIKNHINHVPLPNARLRNLGVTRTRVSTSHGPLDICSAYLPPSKDITEEDFDQIFGTNNSTVLMGDLNAKHPSWNVKVTNSKGLALQQLAQDGGFLVLGPDEPTHIHTPTGTMDVLDVAVLIYHHLC
ncbi:hypothetical protein Trydic_g10533 [Trypoxylus dichotomus]